MGALSVVLGWPAVAAVFADLCVRVPLTRFTHASRLAVLTLGALAAFVAGVLVGRLRGYHWGDCIVGAATVASINALAFFVLCAAQKSCARSELGDVELQRQLDTLVQSVEGFVGKFDRQSVAGKSPPLTSS